MRENALGELRMLSNGRESIGRVEDVKQWERKHSET